MFVYHLACVMHEVFHASRCGKIEMNCKRKLKILVN